MVQRWGWTTPRGLILTGAALSVLLGAGTIGYGTGWLGESAGTRSVADDAAMTDAQGIGPAPTALRTTNGKRMLTLLGAGDVLVHPEVWYQAQLDANGAAFDFLPMLRHVSSAVAGADLAICHLETPLAGQDGPFIGLPKFNVPPQIVHGLKRTGYDACSTASNHALDQGEAGVARTLDALDAQGLGHSGSYRSTQEAARPTIYNVAGVKVGHLSYTLHFNGLTPPPGKEWLANVIEPQKILAAARATRAAGAEIVVLSLHWGTEYDHHPNADQLKWAKPLITSPDVDLVLGHHAHVVQPFEKFGDEWVVYGMGNELARHAEPTNDNREGVMARFTFTEMAPRQWKITKAEAIPTWVDLNPDIRLVDLSVALADPNTSESRRGIYQAAYERIGAHLLSRGAGSAGLVIVSPGDLR